MIKIIAAIGKNRELGKNNTLIWNLPSDLEFFKKQTSGSIVAMGRTTYLSLPKNLPGRKHVILSPEDSFNKDTSDALIFRDKDSFIEYCITASKNEDVYIIGGASIYSMFIDLADSLILTEIDSEDKEADVYFPEFDKEKYTENYLGENYDGEIRYSHIRYDKKV